MSDILFYVLATGIVTMSLLVVALPNILHSAIALIGSLFATAGLYILLRLEMLALAQIALYVGGIVVFMLMIILLTNDLGVDNSLSRVNLSHQIGKGVIIFGLLFALSRFFSANPSAILSMPARQAAPVSFDEIGFRLLSVSNGFIVPFEVISLLLLAALIGAVVLSRRENTKEEQQ